MDADDAPPMLRHYLYRDRYQYETWSAGEEFDAADHARFLAQASADELLDAHWAAERPDTQVFPGGPVESVEMQARMVATLTRLASPGGPPLGRGRTLGATAWRGIRQGSPGACRHPRWGRFRRRAWAMLAPGVCPRCGARREVSIAVDADSKDGTRSECARVLIFAPGAASSNPGTAPARGRAVLVVHGGPAGG